jgi:hypothetical protein
MGSRKKSLKIVQQNVLKSSLNADLTCEFIEVQISQRFDEKLEYIYVCEICSMSSIRILAYRFRPDLF